MQVGQCQIQMTGGVKRNGGQRPSEGWRARLTVTIKEASDQRTPLLVVKVINTGLIDRLVNGGICVVYDKRNGRRMDHREPLIDDAESDNKIGGSARKQYCSKEEKHSKIETPSDRTNARPHQPLQQNTRGGEPTPHAVLDNQSHTLQRAKPPDYSCLHF
ncbi:uncharacterized protein BKA55DRAFT_532759 [Fusarium redolens]|uniref:Uncharacterized protein n=1 Tax=Fusarium redolens TaxID=48865 RepID=A0A9P9KWN7_FUSRE|nr:uncharacterized protein BKA55DRAFT_532759 [Fusarium redolens]KAH7270150.1 hypothetical protein BKA55DRAFT_532759 [Fusarium redolens]